MDILNCPIYRVISSYNDIKYKVNLLRKKVGLKLVKKELFSQKSGNKDHIDFGVNFARWRRRLVTRLLD